LSKKIIFLKLHSNKFIQRKNYYRLFTRVIDCENSLICEFVSSICGAKPKNIMKKYLQSITFQNHKKKRIFKFIYYPILKSN